MACSRGLSDSIVNFSLLVSVFIADIKLVYILEIFGFIVHNICIALCNGHSVVYFTDPLTLSTYHRVAAPQWAGQCGAVARYTG